MITPAARDSWRDLEGKLRPFVARRISSTADVDDVLQEVFLRMQQGISTLRDDERFGPWVYQLARNAVVDHYRRRAPNRADHVHTDDGAPNGAAEIPLANDDSEEVQAAVASYLSLFVAALRSPYREALTLTELQGLTQKQAAEMLGISLSGMKSRVQRGRELLRKALEECCEIALDVRGRVVGCTPRPDGKLPEGCCDNGEVSNGC